MHDESSGCLNNATAATIAPQPSPPGPPSYKTDSIYQGESNAATKDGKWHPVNGITVRVNALSHDKILSEET